MIVDKGLVGPPDTSAAIAREMVAVADGVALEMLLEHPLQNTIESNHGRQTLGRRRCP